MTTSTEIQQNERNGIFKNNETTKVIEAKPGSTILLILEILTVIAQMIYYFIESLYKLIAPTPEKSVSGEIVLITGTGHGIGKELALQYSEHGAIVICVDINKNNNEETVNEINEKTVSKAYGYVCDVSDAEEVKSLAEKIRKEVGDVTILVNNAGIMPCRQYTSYDPDEIKRIFGINVFAHLWLIQTFLPDMINKNHGHIVALSSMAGVLGVENLVPYCASKFAVRGLMEALNEEIRTRTKATNVNITVIYPYMVNTGLCQKPVIRFPSVLRMAEPKQVAKQIITAQRKNITEYSIPWILFQLNAVFRLFPYKVAFIFKDFIGSTLEEHDD